jgi:hypothetical protein
MQDLGKIEAAVDSGNRRKNTTCAAAGNGPRIAPIPHGGQHGWID